MGKRAIVRPSRPTKNFSKFHLSCPLSFAGSALRSTSNTPELEGQHADECGWQLSFWDKQFSFTFAFANILKPTPFAAANAATSSFVPGSCCPNSLHGKARISSPEDANSVCRSTNCASAATGHTAGTTHGQRCNAGVAKIGRTVAPRSPSRAGNINHKCNAPGKRSHVHRIPADVDEAL